MHNELHIANILTEVLSQTRCTVVLQKRTDDPNMYVIEVLRFKEIIYFRDPFL